MRNSPLLFYFYLPTLNFIHINTDMVSMIMGDELLYCKAALVFAVTRCLLSYVLKLITSSLGLFSDSSTQDSSCCSKSNSLRMVKDSLTFTTLGEIEWKLPEGHDTSCAVCLNKLTKKSQVWELSNCNHVFHKQCLESWLRYDNKVTCPLCRSSILPGSASPNGVQSQQPSWAVERMLYLFGDDLLP